MTQEAGFVDCVFLQQLRTGATVWIMAVRADNLAHSDRVRRRLEAVCTLFFVAGVANLGLCHFIEHRISGLVNLMAVVTGDVIHLVHATVPVVARSTFVTSEALC